MSEELRHMRRAGKTFYFASLMLDGSVRRDVAVAYSFCRTVDDIADDNPPSEQRTAALREIAAAVRTRDVEHPISGGMVALLDRFPEIETPVLDLVAACEADVPGLVIRDDAELVSYAHGVAGNVGLLMYPLLGGRDSAGLPLADSLGIAMQCTNIARDVIPDLKGGRLYLPREWLLTEQIFEILSGHEVLESAVVSAVQKLLALGQEHYNRGLQGLSFLDSRSRFAIRVAADCYSAIGRRVIAGGRLRRARAVVPFGMKVALAVRAFGRSAVSA